MRRNLSAFALALRRSVATRLGGLMGLALLVVTCHSDTGTGPCVSTTLAFTAQPGNATAGTTLSTITVQARDPSGSLAACFTGTVSLAIATNPGAGTLLGTTTATAVGGVATFSGLSIQQSGNGYTLRASSGTLTAATSNGFNINPGPASVLVFTTQPASATAVGTIAATVTARDQFANTATGFTSNVTLSITGGTGTAGAALSGTTTVPAGAGVASFANLGINKVGTGYTLTAAAASAPPSSATSAAFNITPGPTSQLAFTVQPSNAADHAAGAPITPAVRVTAQDAQGNITPSFTGAVAIAIAANPGGGTLTGTTPVNAVAGVATFSDLSINRPGTGYTLSASSGIYTATSAPFDVSVGALAQLLFTVEPSNAAAGAPISPAVEVTGQDAVGNTVTSLGTVTVSLATNPNGGNLSGTLSAAAVSGVATFSDLILDKSGPGYRLQASAGAVTSAQSSAFDIAGGSASTLVFTQQPGTATAVGTIAATVTARDQFGNTATSFTSAVTLSITTGTGTAGAALSGITTVAATAGVASFTGLGIDKVGTGYTLTAAAASSPPTPATSAAFNITPGPTSQLAFTVQPSSAAAGAAIAPAVQVTAQDAQGNITPAFTGAVTVAIGNNPGSGTLTGTTPANAVAGVATFSDLRINRPGTGYTLTASSGALTAATSAAFDVAAGALAQLVFTQEPANATAGAAIAPAIVVTGQDAVGNTATSFTGDVTMSIGTNPAGGTLSGTLTVAAAAGVATFSDLSIDKSGTGYVLTATAGAASKQSAAFAIIPGAATQLVFTTQPENTVAGAAVTPAVVVTARDAFGNTATSFGNGVTVAITGGTGTAGATLSGTTTKIAGSGIVSFNDLSIDSAGTSYTLSATATGLVGAFASATFNITAGTATQLAFTTQPANATAGAAIAPAVVVTARDAQGNRAIGFTGDVTVAFGTNAGAGTLSGTLLRTAVSGVATFNDLSIDKSGTGYTLTAAATSLTGATSTGFNIIAGAATKLVFTGQPVNTAAGAPITPAVQVSARDALDNLDLSYTGNVTAAIGTNAGTPTPGTLSGTQTKAAVSGVATFSDLSIDRVGTAYTLTAAATSLIGATSTTFNIIASTATHLVFTVQPSDAVAGVAIAPAITVTALDGSNNVATDFTAGVTLAITSGTGGLGATLSGTPTVTAVAGVATFSDLSIDKSGTGYTLDATAGGLTGATSTGFSITPGAATHLAFSVEPTGAAAGAAIAPAVTVSALDGLGNVDPAYTADVTVAIGTNPGSGTLSGTATVAAVTGVATFSDLSIDKSGTGYTLHATSGTLTDATSAAFNISHAALSQMVFTVEPTNTVAGAAITPAVEVTGQDQFGNTVTSFTGNVTVAIGTNPGGGTLSGTALVAAVGGVATFSDLKIDKAASGYTLSATATGASAGASTAFDITVGAASVLVFTVQPGNTTAGASIAPPITVAAQDGQGNTVTTFGDDITLAIGTNAGGGTLTGTTTTTPVAGVATFSNLSIDKAGTGYTLSATAVGLVGTFPSAAFDITAGAATTLAFTVQPLTTTAGAAITPAVQVSAQDALGNTDPTFTSDVTVAITGGTGTAGASLSGTLTVAAASGVATFSGLSIDSAGTAYTLTATGGSLTAATSAGFNINAGAATQLALTQQPSNAVAGASIAPAVTVTARDGLGNTDPNFAGLVTLEFVNNAGSPVPGVLSGATATPSLGVATFATLSVNKVGTGYTIRATAGGVASSPTSSAFNITPGAPAQLVFTVQPTQTTVGAAISPAVKVTAQDANANTTPAFSSNVSIGKVSGTGTFTGSTLTQAAIAGVATFTNLKLDAADTYVLSASATGLSSGTSDAFDVVPSTATQLFFSVQPGATTAGAAISPDIVVQARDASGQVVTGFTGAGNEITLAITSGTGVPGASLTGITTVAAVNGVATFPGLSIDKSSSNYRLTATATGLSANSGFFTINPGAADHLVFAVQPSNATALASITPQVEVMAQDVLNNTVTSFTGNVTVAITPLTGNPLAALSGTTTKAAVAGVAAFTNLSIDLAGPSFQLDATGVGVPTGATSTTFDITLTAGNRLVFTVPPSAATAGQSITPAVQVTAQDGSGTTLTGFTGNVTVSITAGTGTSGASLTGTNSVAAVDGVATFGDLAIDKKGTGYRLSVVASGFAGATSGTFVINGGVATRLEFTTEPATTAAGQTITPAVVAQARDNFGNLDNTFVGTVTLAISTNPAGGTLSGTTTVAAAAGVATFSDLSIERSSSGYRLAASSSGLIPDTSSAFRIDAGAADHLLFTVAPSSAKAGADISDPNIRVTAFDVLGNIATGFTDNVTLDITLGTGTAGATLTGTNTVAAASGVAIFSVTPLSIDRVGTGYTLSASTPTVGVAGTTSVSFNISADRLFFTVQPSTTPVNTNISPAVQVAAGDGFGNIDPSFTGNVTVSKDPASPLGALSGTLTQPAVAGIATFNDLKIGTSNSGFRLRAAATGLTLATSDLFDITP